MSDHLFTVTSPAGSLAAAAERLVADLDVSDLGDQVLAVMIVQLARTIDASARNGRASAGAMAAKELREALADLRSRQDLPDAASTSGEFATFREYMLGLVNAS